MTQWTVLRRADCSLCEQMLAELAGLLDPAEAARVVSVDIDQDAALAGKYGGRIPVLLADGEFVCNYRLDVARVRLVAGR